MKYLHVLSVTLFLLGGSWAEAMFIPPQQTPVDRLIHTATEYLKKHPDDATAHYTLGRIYYLAFSLKRDTVPILRPDDKDDEPIPAPDWMAGWSDDNKKIATSLPNSTMADYSSQARHEFDEAIKRDPNNGLYYLGLGCLLEETRKWELATKPGNLRPDMSGIQLSQIRAAYEKALSLDSDKDSTLTERPVPGVQCLVTYEAASNLVRLAEEKQFQGTEEKDVENAKALMAKLEKLPMGAITPMVFSFSPGRHLSDFLAPQTVIDFDLRGYGPREQWTWVKPALGILVWDPEHTGRITSARQLFGNYSFQIFRANGYDALAALDDNGDGVLSGAELKGISVWFDRNSNGVSDPGEVCSVEDLHIRAIATTARGMDGIHPTNATGIVLEDGRTYRTWDWITQPVPRMETKLALEESR